MGVKDYRSHHVAAMANLAMWVTATGECYTCYRNDDIEQVAWTDYVTAVTTTPRL